ncbi:unnamed protein product, partial [Brassica napus]
GEKASRFNTACRRRWKLPFLLEELPTQVSFFSTFVYLPCSSWACLLIWYAYSGPGIFKSVKEASKVSAGDYSCTSQVQRAVSLLKKAYGDGMRKVLHVGPETCSVVSTLLKEDDTEAWGVEPYDIEDADSHCKSLVSKGLVRVADIKFPLPYRAKSFSLVIVSDALDYLSPKYLNKTLPELARVASDGVVLFAGLPGQQKAKVAELSKFGRPVSLLHPVLSQLVYKWH